MSSSRIRAVVVLLGLAALSIERPAASPTSTYAIIDLGTLAGGESSQANDINNRGQVVGASLVAGYFQAFLWDAGEMTALPPLSGDVSAVANGINDRSQIAGSSGGVNDVWRAVLWDEGTPVDLGRLPGAISCSAQAINNRGQVVGACDLQSGGQGGFLWEGGVMTPLSARLNSAFTFPTSINHHAQVAGVTIDPFNELRAFRWKAGTIADLGTLAGGRASYAGGINHRGMVAGWSQDAQGEFFAVLWKKGGGVANLGTSPGKTWSQAFAINDRGAVGGRVEQTPALWHGDAITELPTLQGGSGIAFAINNRGELAGVADTHTGQPRAVFWTDGRQPLLDRTIIHDVGPDTGLVTPGEGRGSVLFSASNSQNFVDSVSFGRDTVISGLNVYTSSSHLPLVGTHVHVKFFLDAGGAPGGSLAELDLVPTSITFLGTFPTIGGETADVHKVNLRFDPIQLKGRATYWVGASGLNFDSGLYGVLGGGDGQMMLFDGDTLMGPAPVQFGDLMFQLLSPPRQTSR
jgi:probable HAF family extracellular repeat protein